MKLQSFGLGLLRPGLRRKKLVVFIPRRFPLLASSQNPGAQTIPCKQTRLYTSWEEIELDDGVWEVDDAVHSDGKKYDLRLAPESLEITERELD